MKTEVDIVKLKVDLKLASISWLEIVPVGFFSTTLNKGPITKAH